MPPTTYRVFGVELAPSPDEARELHVVILHDDHPAYVRALRMLANTLAGHPEAPGLRPLPWQFADLGRKSWRKRSIADAPRADVIVVSTSTGGDLPAEVSQWLKECFAVRHNMQTAVIALCASLNDLEVPWRRLLHDAAATAGFDFIETGAPSLLPVG